MKIRQREASDSRLGGRWLRTRGTAGAFRLHFNGAANSEDSRGTARLTETDLAANREAFALRGSDTDLWITAAPLLPTRNSEEPEK